MKIIYKFTHFTHVRLNSFKRKTSQVKIFPHNMDVLVRFSDFVAYPFKCFKVFGLIPYDPVEEQTWRKKLLKVYHYVVIADQILTLFMMSVFIKEHVKELTLVTESSPGCGYALLAVVKSISIYMRKEEFKDLMETLDDLFPKTQREQNIFKVRKYVKGYRRMQKIFSTIAISVGVIFMIAPVIKLILTGVWNDKLPYEGWYPFDEHDPRFYTFVWLWQIGISCITVVSILGPDLILYAFITMISMQFDILCRQLRSLKNFSRDEIYRELLELVKLHNTLIRLSNNLEKIYSVSILFNFMGSSILICLVGYQVTVGISTENLVKFIIFLTGSLVQVLILCYYGNKLSFASENVSIAVYSSGWERGENRRMRNAVLLMMQRSQKPSFISAYKFSKVSLEAYATVECSSFIEGSTNWYY